MSKANSGEDDRITSRDNARASRRPLLPDLVEDPRDEAKLKSYLHAKVAVWPPPRKARKEIGEGKQRIWISRNCEIQNAAELLGCLPIPTPINLKGDSVVTKTRNVSFSLIKPCSADHFTNLTDSSIGRPWTRPQPLGYKAVFKLDLCHYQQV